MLQGGPRPSPQVEVLSSSNWIWVILNIPEQSILIKVLILMGVSRIFFEEEQALQSLYQPPPTLIQYMQRPLGRVRVFLDYDNGTVSLYDVYFPSFLLYLSSEPVLCLGSLWSQVSWVLIGELPCQETEVLRPTQVRQQECVWDLWARVTLRNSYSMATKIIYHIECINLLTEIHFHKLVYCEAFTRISGIALKIMLVR